MYEVCKSTCKEWTSKDVIENYKEAIRVYRVSEMRGDIFIQPEFQKNPCLAEPARQPTCLD